MSDTKAAVIDMLTFERDFKKHIADPFNRESAPCLKCDRPALLEDKAHNVEDDFFQCNHCGLGFRRSEFDNGPENAA